MRPDTEAALAEIIHDASGPLRLCGGGTRAGYLGAEGRDVDLSGLSGISIYEPGALTLVAGAGTPLAEIEAALDSEGQMLPFEPPRMGEVLGRAGESTIGGVVAQNASGPRRFQAGACRDSLIGVRFVDGRGDILRNGGRVMKNVTGYDLVKLLAGSHGTLGALSEVAFKLLPKPAHRACLMVDGLSDAEAIAVMARALSSPFEVSGAAHVPKGLDGYPVTMLRLEGFAESVAYRLEALAALLDGVGPMRRETDPEQVAVGWRWIRDGLGFAGREGDLWRISCRASDAADLAARSGGAVLYDWGGARIWSLVAPGTDLRARLGAYAGHATLIRAEPETHHTLGTFEPEAPGVAALSRGLRQQFDPKGILNPGVMGA